MKKGFTLIELLGVIMVLAIIALVTTPLILDVVDEAKRKTDLNNAYGYIEAAKLYYYESQFDDNKRLDVDNLNNIYNKITVKGTKPDTGELYVNSNGSTSLAVTLGNKCYKKDFDGDIYIIEDDETCEIGWIGIDDVLPIVSYTIDGTLGNNGWYKSDVYIHVRLDDNESGPSRLGWCMGIDCEINETNIEREISKDIILSNTSSAVVCMQGYDKYGNASERVCTEDIKADSVLPIFSGVEDLTIIKNNLIDLREGVTIEDGLSGVTDYTVTPETIDTTVAGNYEIMYEAVDKAGNKKELKRNIIVDALAPTITYEVIDSVPMNDWYNEYIYVKMNITDNSGSGIKESYSCVSTSSSECEPKTELTELEKTFYLITEGDNRICIKTIDNNNKESNLCSDVYKIDKTLPEAGTAIFGGTLGSNDWYTSDVTVTAVDGSDGMSGHLSTNVNISSILENTEGTIVTVTTTDKAGNSNTREYTIKVDKETPTINRKSNETLSISSGENINYRDLFDITYGVSLEKEFKCDSQNLTLGLNNIQCTATANNGKSQSIDIELIVEQDIENSSETATNDINIWSKYGTKLVYSLGETTVTGSGSTSSYTISGYTSYAFDSGTGKVTLSNYKSGTYPTANQENSWAYYYSLSGNTIKGTYLKYYKTVSYTNFTIPILSERKIDTGLSYNLKDWVLESEGEGSSYTVTGKYESYSFDSGTGEIYLSGYTSSKTFPTGGGENSSATYYFKSGNKLYAIYIKYYKTVSWAMYSTEVEENDNPTSSFSFGEPTLVGQWEDLSSYTASGYRAYSLDSGTGTVYLSGYTSEKKYPTEEGENSWAYYYNYSESEKTLYVTYIKYWQTVSVERYAIPIVEDETPRFTSTYVYSTDENAYPNNDFVDEYYYSLMASGISTDIFVKSKPKSIITTANEVTFSVELENEANQYNKITYQWYKANNYDDNGILLEGETNPQLTLSDLTVGDSYYYCIITNSVGTYSNTLKTNTVLLKKS